MRVLVLLIVLLSARRTLLAQVSAGIEVQSSTWEKGIAEVTLRSTFPVQSSGITGETIVKGRCEALIQKVTMASGKTADVMQNFSGTIVGLNFRPATEVNQIYLV